MNILFTSAGRRGYLIRYFKEVIGNGEIHVANSSSDSTAMLFADKTIITPLIYDESYIPFLLNYCIEYRINVIIPLFDVDLRMLAKNKEKFERIGVTVIVSNEKTVEICNDKWMTYNYLKSNGYETPVTFLSLEEALDSLKKKCTSFPFIVKPRWGMGSMLVYEVANIEELKVLYKKVRNSLANTYLSYESKQNMEESVLIQEKVVGQEFGLDIINNLDGCYETTIVKRKLSMRAGETDTAVTVDDVTLRHLGEHLSRTVGHIGNLDVDIIKSEKGKSYILEMNARFGGGYPFSHIAGVNLPRAIIGWLTKTAVEENELKAEAGIVGYKDINVISKERERGAERHEQSRGMLSKI